MLLMGTTPAEGKGPVHAARLGALHRPRRSRTPPQRHPVGLELDFYRADGDELPGSLDEVAFYVLPYMKGPAVLDRAADMPKLQVVQTLTAGYEEFLPLVPPGVTLCNAAGLHDTSTASSRSRSPWPAAGTWTSSPATSPAARGGSPSAGPWPTSGS